MMKKKTVSGIEFDLVDPDHPALQALEREVLANPPPAFSILLEAHAILSPGYLLACVDGEPAGAAVLLGEGPELYRIYVAKAFRRKGVGQALVADAFDKFRKAGRTQVCIQIEPSSHAFWSEVLDGHELIQHFEKRYIFSLSESRVS